MSFFDYQDTCISNSNDKLTLATDTFLMNLISTKNLVKKLLMEGVHLSTQPSWLISDTTQKTLSMCLNLIHRSIDPISKIIVNLIGASLLKATPTLEVYMIMWRMQISRRRSHLQILFKNEGFYKIELDILNTYQSTLEPLRQNSMIEFLAIVKVMLSL